MIISAWPIIIIVAHQAGQCIVWHGQKRSTHGNWGKQPTLHTSFRDVQGRIVANWNNRHTRPALQTGIQTPKKDQRNVELRKPPFGDFLWAGGGGAGLVDDTSLQCLGVTMCWDQDHGRQCRAVRMREVCRVWEWGLGMGPEGEVQRLGDAL